MISLRVLNKHASGKGFVSQISLKSKKVIPSWKFKKSDYPTICFNDVPVVQTNCQKHLRMYLNKKLNLLYHTKEKTLNANKRIRVILNLKHILPRYSLITYEHLLLDVILITVILSLINPTMKASELEMKRYNRMLRLQVHELLEKHLKPKWEKNLGLAF